MPHFVYKAVGRDGKPLDGSIEAEGLELASRQLRAQGLTLLKLEAGAARQTGSVSASGKAPGREEVLSVTSELAVLLRAGLPLDRSLKVLIDMSAQPAMESILRELLKSVKGGKALSSALQGHDKVFSGFYINMVRAGEASGQLSAVLDRLVEYLQSAKATRDSVISAMVYPAILLTVSVISVAVMLGFVVPQFEPLFEDMGEALPAMTRGVLAAADFITAYAWLLAALAVGIYLYVRSWLRSEAGREKMHQQLLDLPIAGSIVFQFEISKFARTAGTLLGNGVSLLKAISIAIETVDNKVIRESLEVLPPAVKSGKRISASLEATGKFTPMVVQMVRVGEESGSLDSMMLELARVYEDQVDAGIKRGLALLEPVLIMVMGVLIAVIIIAILMGIMSVNDLAI
ncbi:MAG: type II secretion system F family protein [Pseudomonadota bacterium]